MTLEPTRCFGLKYIFPLSCIGTSVEAEVLGKRQLKLLKHGETYVMNAPKLSMRFIPGPGADWAGNVRIRCQETGLEAELCYRTNSFLWRRGNHRSIKGKIFESSSMKTLYVIEGHWDRYLTIKCLSDSIPPIIQNELQLINLLLFCYSCLP